MAQFCDVTLGLKW